MDLGKEENPRTTLQLDYKTRILLRHCVLSCFNYGSQCQFCRDSCEQDLSFMAYVFVKVSLSAQYGMECLNMRILCEFLFEINCQLYEDPKD